MYANHRHEEEHVGRRLLLGGGEQRDPSSQISSAGRAARWPHSVTLGLCRRPGPPPRCNAAAPASSTRASCLHSLIIMTSCSHIVAPLIESGDLHAARFKALEWCTQAKPAISPWETAPSTGFFDAVAGKDCAVAWKEQVGLLLAQPDALSRITDMHSPLEPLSPPPSPPPPVQHVALENWGKCCSRLSAHDFEACGTATPGSAPCALSNGSSAALLLPMLREPSVQLRLAGGNVDLLIDQDGFLRPFDVATVLWPAGYLLALWAADGARSRSRPLPDGSLSSILSSCPVRDPAAVGSRSTPPSVLELGTGTGAASLAMAAFLGDGANVVATDREVRSLALATANAASNRISLATSRLDYESDEEVEAFAAAHKGGFDVILGGALMAFAESPRLWSVLRSLTYVQEEASPSAASSAAATSVGSTVALAHTVGAIKPPPHGSGFQEVERISGLEYGLHTRWAANESDFEVVVLRRAAV